MSLQLAIYDRPNGRMLADWSTALDVEISTNEHGYQALTAFLRMPAIRAFYWFDRPGLPHLVLVDNVMTVWEGRLEDVRLITGGIEIVALGYWSVLGDVPFNGTPSNPTTGDQVARDVLDDARADNPTLLRAAYDRIDTPGVDLYDEEYEDADMRAVLTRIAALGDDQVPPRQWEAGVWEDGRLHFRPRSTEGRDWYTEVAELEVERSLSAVWNSVYSRYDNGASATAIATDSESVTRYGVTRRQARSSHTTDSAQAERERDAALADNATPIPRASVEVTRIMTANGTPAPLWCVRSGDTLTLRNLPPETGNAIDRIRTFRIAETRYRCDDHTLEVTPEAPLPRVDVLLARSLEVPA